MRRGMRSHSTFEKGFSNSRKFRFGLSHGKDAISFLFSNFPDGWKSKELWRVFVRYSQGLERVGDIFIPDRKDIKGGNFGFVRFLDVKNVQALLGALDSIWFDSYKLRVTVAKEVVGSRK
ncbi:hypothetical protein REPUB_Repub15cG0054200 [Reevesia pubescens]